MSGFTWLRDKPKSVASVAGLTVAAVAIGALAVAYDGNPRTEVDLNDGGVWVTKESSFLVGHFNNESTVLDGALRTSSTDFDLLQSGSRVLVIDRETSSVSAIDPARVALAETADLPPGSDVALAGDTVAVIGPTDGALWVMPYAGVSGFGSESYEPIAELGEGAVATAGEGDQVHAVSRDTGILYTYGRVQGHTKRQRSVSSAHSPQPQTSKSLRSAAMLLSMIATRESSTFRTVKASKRRQRRRCNSPAPRPRPSRSPLPTRSRCTPSLGTNRS